MQAKIQAYKPEHNSDIIIIRIRTQIRPDCNPDEDYDSNIWITTRTRFQGKCDIYTVFLGHRVDMYVRG